jgi:O-antigen/teichoic acid export membrane protein
VTRPSPPSAPAARGNTLSRSAALTAAPQLTTLVAALIVSPYMVAQVGLTAFGFWSLVQAALSYAQIGNGGFPSIATRLVASAYERDDRDTMFEAFWLTLAVMVTLSVFVVGAAAVFAVAAPASLSETLPRGWRGVAVEAAGAFSLLMVSQALGAMVQGMHRWDINSAVLACGQIAWAIATFLALEAGLGLSGLALGASMPGLVSIIGYVVATKHLLGRFDRPRRPSGAVWQTFKSQSANLQIVALVNATNAQADRFLLLPFAPLSWIGAYALGSRMAAALRSFPLAAFAPLVARGSAVHTTEGLDGVRDVYTGALRVVAGYGTPILLGLYGAMYPAVLAWLGTDFTVSATAALVLGCFYAVNIATGPGTALALGCGRSEIDRDFNLLGMALNLGLTPPLGMAFGPWGVVAATGLGLVTSSIWLLRKIDGWLGTSALTTLIHPRSRLPAITAGISISALTVLVALAIAPASRLENVGLAAIASVATIAAVAGDEARRQLMRFVRRR